LLHRLLPDFGSLAQTHGDSYQEAVKNGEEVLELLIEKYLEDGRELPKPSSVAFAQS
jgi:antitoxin HicB